MGAWLGAQGTAGPLASGSTQGQGCWNALEPLPLQPWQGLSVTLDATPSSYDQRPQTWVFALCVHTFSLGTLLRKGAITGMAPGPQTKARALFQGLITLAQHVLTPINVIVQLGSVWEAWTNPRKRKGFEDLAKGFDEHLFNRITPLYIHKNQRTPDAPGSEPHLRRRQRDAALAAYERASTLYDQHANMQRIGKRRWTRIIFESTNKQQPDWRRSTKTHNTLSMRSQSGKQGTTPSSTRNGSSTNVSSHGSPTNTSGSHTGADSSATPATPGCTKLSQLRPSSCTSSRIVNSLHARPRNPTSDPTSWWVKRPPEPVPSSN